MISITLVVAALTVTNLISRKRLSDLKDQAPTEGILYTQFNYVYTVLTGQGILYSFNKSFLFCIEYASQSFPFLLNSGSTLSSRSLAMRLTAGVWCLMSIVLVNAYLGSFMSRLALPKYDPIVESFEELADGNKLQVMAAKGSVFASACLVVHSALYITLLPYRILYARY